MNLKLRAVAIGLARENGRYKARVLLGLADDDFNVMLS